MIFRHLVANKMTFGKHIFACRVIFFRGIAIHPTLYLIWSTIQLMAVDLPTFSADLLLSRLLIPVIFKNFFKAKK